MFFFDGLVVDIGFAPHVLAFLNTHQSCLKPFNLLFCEFDPSLRQSFLNFLFSGLHVAKSSSILAVGLPQVDSIPVMSVSVSSEAPIVKVLLEEDFHLLGVEVIHVLMHPVFHRFEQNLCTSHILGLMLVGLTPNKEGLS